MKMIETQIIANRHLYSADHVFTDEEYLRKLALKARRTAVLALDRLITTRLITALIADGYSIRANVMEGDPKYKRSKNAEKVVQHLLEFDMAEVVAFKGNDEAWFRLIFGASGWDVVQDYTVDIAKIVDAAINPYLPWNRESSSSAERA